MALIFTSPIANLFLFQSIQYLYPANTFTCTIFSGTQPNAAQITSSWSTYSANYLVHWTAGSWVAPTSPDTFDAPQLMTANVPLAKTAFRSGTASWAILWPQPSVTEALVQGATLPSTKFLVVPVTVNGGNGVVKLTDTNIVVGNSYQPNDITIRAGIV